MTGNRLLVTGEVTPSQLASFTQKSKSLGEGVQFESEVTLRASPYHFEVRTPSSPIEGEPLRSLSQKLSDSTLTFTPQSAELSRAGKATAHRLVEQILESPPQTTFVLGGHPDNFGKELARQRAQKIRAFLIENGIPPTGSKSFLSK